MYMDWGLGEGVATVEKIFFKKNKTYKSTWTLVSYLYFKEQKIDYY